jgi:prophage maintenance system killer protein
MASTLHYLTVQDVLWINFEVTRKRNAFSFATLEEATYYQYAYGESDSLLPQAARFVSGFLKLHPFEAGNPVTAFVALIAFLRTNGQCLELDDASALPWFERISPNRSTALEGLRHVAHAESEHGHTGSPDTRGIIQTAISGFPLTIAALAERA